MVHRLAVLSAGEYDQRKTEVGKGMGYSHRSRGKKGGWRNVLAGKPGVVYILDNPSLRAGLLKIGGSKRSGAIRAVELNREAGTGTPGVYRCVFEFPCLDCGAGERQVHRALAKQRTGGKWGQEFFDVDMGVAIETIRRICLEVDAELAPPVQIEPPRQITKSAPTAPPAVAQSLAQERAAVISVATDRTREVPGSGPANGSDDSFDKRVMAVLVVMGVGVLAWVLSQAAPAGENPWAVLEAVAAHPGISIAVAIGVVAVCRLAWLAIADRGEPQRPPRRWSGPEPLVRYSSRPPKDDHARSIRDDFVRPLRAAHPHRPEQYRPPVAPPPPMVKAEPSGESRMNRADYWRQLGGRIKQERHNCRRCDAETAVVEVGLTKLCSDCGSPLFR